MDMGIQMIANRSTITTGSNRHIINTANATHLGLDFDWTSAGSGVSTVALYFSNDKNADSTADTGWKAASDYVMTNLSGATGSKHYPVIGVCARYTMIKITYSSGTSNTYTITAQLKG